VFAFVHLISKMDVLSYWQIKKRQTLTQMFI